MNRCPIEAFHFLRKKWDNIVGAGIPRPLRLLRRSGGNARPYDIGIKMITTRWGMINAGAGKTKRRVLIAHLGQPKLDTFESHMTFFATLSAEYCSLTTALIIIMRPSLHTWPQRDSISSSIQEGFK